MIMGILGALFAVNNMMESVPEKGNERGMYIFTFIKQMEATPEGVNIADVHSLVVFSETREEALSRFKEDAKKYGFELAFQKFPKNLQKMFFPENFLSTNLALLNEEFIDDEPYINDDQMTMKTEEGYFSSVQKNSLMKKIIDSKDEELFSQHLDEFSVVERLYIKEKLS